MKTRLRIILLSIGLGLVAWIIDALLDALVFYDETFMDRFLLRLPPHELYFRLIILAIFIITGVIVSGLLAQRASTEHALRESQRRLKTLMDNLPGMAYRCLNDGNWTMKFVSEGAHALTGYRFAELIDNRVRAYDDLIVPEDRQAVREAVQEGIQSGEPYKIAYRITTVGGEEKWVWEQGEAVRSPDGDGLVLEGFITDITERKQAEKASLTVERRYRETLKNLALVAVILDTEGRITFCNDHVSDLTGWSHDEIVGHDWFGRFIPSEMRDDLRQVFDKTVITGEFPTHYENPILTRSGEKRLVRWSNTPLWGPDGAVTGVASIGEDITEHKQAEEALRESEERNRTTLYSIGDAVITTDKQGRIQQMNPVAEALTGWREAEAAGKLLSEIFQIVNEKTGVRIDNPAERVLEAGDTVGLANHTLLIARDGTEYPIADSGAPVRNEQGEVTGVVLVFRDQTEERAGERALRESEGKYRSLFENMLSGFAYHRIVLDEDGQPVDYIFLDVNEAFEQQTGLKRENIIGKRVTEVIPGIEEEGWIERYGQVALTGESIRFEQHAEALNRWYGVSAYSPQPEHFVTVFHDITERVKMESDLRASEGRSRTTLYSIGDAVITTDNQGRVQQMNPVAEALTGWREAEAADKPLTEVFHIVSEETGVRIENPVERVLEAGAIVGLANHTLLIARDGKEYPIADSGAPIRNEEGEITGVVLVFRDQTKERAAERALRREHEKAQRYLDIASVIIVALDREGLITLINRRGCEVLGYEEAELIGKDWFTTCLPERVRDEVRRIHALNMASSSDFVDYTENSVLTKLGEGRVIAWHNTVIRDDDGNITGSLSSGQDITEHKQAEEALLQSEARLAAFTGAMPDLGFVLDEDGAYLEVVGTQEDLLAAAVSELKGHYIHDALPPDVVDKCLAAIREALAAGEVQSLEYSLDVPAGRRWFEGRISPMNTDVVAARAVVFVARDITERRQTEDAERRQRLLAETLRDTAAMLHSTLELDEVLDRILRAVEELLPHSGANIMLFDEASGEPRIAKHCACYEAHGLTVPAAPPASVIADLLPFSEILRTRQPAIAADMHEYPNWPDDIPSIQWVRSYLGAPILVDGEVVGLINLDSDEVDQYTLDDAEVLAALANQAAAAIDSARLYEQARQQRLLAEALRDTAEALHGTLELDEVLDRILEATEELVPHSGANIILADETSGALKLARYCSCYKVNGLTEPQMPEGDLTALNLYREIVRTHEALIVPDTHAHHGWPTDNPSIQWIRSYLCAPIIVDGEVAGYINLDGSEADAFAPDNAEALMALAGQAAIAIDGARLYEDAQRRANELEALRRITMNITTQFDLDALLADLMRSVQELLEVNAAGLYLYRPEADVLEWVIGLGQTKMKVGSILRRGEGLSGKVWETGEPLTIQDYANWEGKADHYDIGSRATILGIPIHWGDETLGVVNAGRYGDASYSFSDRDIRLLSLFADQAAIAIRNAQLFDQVEERARYLAALNRASSRVSRWGLDLDGVLQAVVTTLTEEIDLDYARIWLADKEDETLKIRASAGWREQPGTDGMGDMVPDRTGRLAEIAQSGKPFLTNSVREDEAFDREWAARHNIVAFAGYPLRKDRRLMAVLTIFHSQPLADTVLDVMGSFVNQAAIAIENARLYEELETYSGILEQAVAERTADLERAKEQVESILHYSPDGIVLLKPDGMIETMNPAAQVMLGYSEDELSGQYTSMLIEPSHISRCKAAQDNVRLENATQKVELLMRRKDGATFDAQAVLGPMLEGDSLLGIVCSLRDITALKEVERIKDDFLATAAHELRTPLTSIRGFSELLITRDLSRERQERYHRHINDQSTQLANIIDDLLDISRLESGRALDLKLALVHMSALIEEVVDPFAETMPEHTFRLDLKEDRPVRGDAFRLSQVVRNLVLNAVKYSPSGGEITIKSRVREDMLEISVSDQGIGITEKQQAHLFEKFYRVDPSGTSGTGLGLVICKLIVEGHGGEIRVESQPGEGSTFTFTLPLAG